MSNIDTHLRSNSGISSNGHRGNRLRLVRSEACQARERPIEDARKFLAGGVEIERQKEVSRLGVRADSDHITRQQRLSSNYSMIISEDTGKSLTPAGGLRFLT